MSALDVVAAPASAVILDAEHPWPGLDAFPESGHAFFHGRDREIDRLVRLVRDEPLVLLHGESGLGKTSLLQAGLFPRLRMHGFLPVLVRLDFSPSAGPLTQQVRDRIAQELESRSVDGPRPEEGERLWEYSHRPDGWLWSPRQTPLLPLVVLDQFEELFTLGGGPTTPDARDLVDEVAEVVLDRVPGRDVERLDDFDRSRAAVKVVLSFRDEFLAHVETLLAEFGPAMQARLRLTAFDQLLAERSVLDNGGALVVPEVATRIVRVVSGGRDTVEPSLLSVFCRELNERRLAEGAATISVPLVANAGAAVLPEFYARSTRDVAEPVLEFVEERLLTEGQRRNIVTLEEAVAAPGVTRAALDTLVRRRLIRIEERFGAERVELSHDVLAPIVAEVRRERRARREERRLEERLEQERRVALIFSKRRKKFARWLAVAFVGGSAVAVYLLSTAKAAERASAGLAAQGYLFDAADASSDALRAANAAAAVAVTPDLPAASSGLLSILSRLAVPLVQVEHGDVVESAVFSPDGGRVLTTSNDRTARVWDARTGAPLGAPLRHGSIVESAVFSPDGGRVLTASFDQTARVWDARTGAPLVAPLQHGGSVTSAEFSPDGGRVVTASADQTARVWDARTGAPPGAPLQHGGSVTSAVFSPDGGRVVTASDDHTARVWDARTGAPLGAPLQHDGIVRSGVFSPDGGRVVTASYDQTARVWDAQTGAPLGAPLRHGSIVESAVFSPDGGRVVTASDQTARVWDARTGAPLGAPLQHGGIVSSAVFSPDGGRVVTASFDQTARVWDARTGAPLGAPLQHLLRAQTRLAVLQ